MFRYFGGVPYHRIKTTLGDASASFLKLAGMRKLPLSCQTQWKRAVGTERRVFSGHIQKVSWEEGEKEGEASLASESSSMSHPRGPR